MTNVDVLTYGAISPTLNGVVEEHGERYEFFKADIANADQMDALMTEHRFYAVLNFAAESHVDWSINDPLNFIHTNVIGTSVLLDCAPPRRPALHPDIDRRSHGSLGPWRQFTEQSLLDPSSRIQRAKPVPIFSAIAAHKLMARRCW